MKDLPNLTEFHKKLAIAQGLDLYAKYDEEQAAKALDLSVVSLRRLRGKGEIDFVRVSPRKICFFGFQLIQCLINAVESETCPDTTPKSHSKSESSGFRSAPRVKRGTGHGLTAKLDKHAALASAHRILTRPSKH
ncbi:MAG: hypothetical protein AAF642_07935 [Pseudomonadota bacterium]